MHIRSSVELYHLELLVVIPYNLSYQYAPLSCSNSTEKVWEVELIVFSMLQLLALVYISYERKTYIRLYFFVFFVLVQSLAVLGQCILAGDVDRLSILQLEMCSFPW